jgi:hypothetical protein
MTLTETRSAAGDDASRVRLDNLTLARKEGWRRFVNSPARIAPEPLTRAELGALGEEAVEDYNRRRREWRPNRPGRHSWPRCMRICGTLSTAPHMSKVICRRGRCVLVSAKPRRLAFACQYHRREIKALGDITESGDERWPVCRVGLTGNTGMKEFNRAMLEFFAHPGTRRGTAADYARRAFDCVLSCEVRVLIIDDLHFLQWRNSSGIATSNHFKYIANDYLQPNQGRSERVSGVSEIPGIASWMGLPSVVQHGAGGIDEGAAGVDAGHGFRVVDCAR